ncbi:MAG: DUF2182 domain-containing protein [Acidobacteriota bacterium]
MKADIRDRVIILTGLAAIALPSWYYTARAAWEMYHMEQAPNMWMPHGGPWTLTEFWLLFAMWTVMMAAMMLPSITPLTLLFASASRGCEECRPYAATAWFVSGYLVSWTLFSAAVTGLQYGLHQAAILSPMMISRSAQFGSLLLCVAGVFQLTPWKYQCLGHCRTSGDMVRGCIEPGLKRAFRIGFQHGICCMGCCWAVMALLFVTGVMNLTWVVALTALVLLERVMPGGQWLARAAGATFIAWGVFLALAKG